MDNRYIRYKHSQKGGNIHKTTESKFFDDLFESNSGTEGNINDELSMVGGNDKFFNNLFSEDGLDSFNDEQNGGGFIDWLFGFGKDEESKKE